MPIVIAIVILLVLVGCAVVIRKGSSQEPGLTLERNMLWADAMTQAGEVTTGKKNIFRAAWSRTGLKQAFASLQTPVVAIMALSAWETDWGNSHAAMAHNNLSGISTNDVPRAYANIGEWFNAMKALLQQPRYAGAMATSSPAEFITKLHEEGYNSNNSWLTGVLSLVAELSAGGEA
jgi:uncharacterized protein YceK